MNETVIEKSHDVSDEQSCIEHIDDTLHGLSLERLKEVSAFVGYIADRERRHKEFVEETLRFEKEPTMSFKTAEEAFNAIFNET